MDLSLIDATLLFVAYGVGNHFVSLFLSKRWPIPYKLVNDKVICVVKQGLEECPYQTRPFSYLKTSLGDLPVCSTHMRMMKRVNRIPESYSSK